MNTEFEYVEEDETHEIVLTHPACGSVDIIESDSFPSFGGTTEGYIKCLNCGRIEDWADFSAII